MKFNLDCSTIFNMTTTTKGLKQFSGDAEEDVYGWIQRLFLARILEKKQKMKL
jgi:hypothetical protein